MKKIKRLLRPPEFLGGLVRAITAFVLIVILLYPFWHVVMYSLSDTHQSVSGGLFLVPRGLNAGAYKYILNTSKIYRVTLNSLAKTAIGTLLSMTVTILMAFPLAQKDLKGKRVIMLFAYFTMLFGGGMIPTYIVIKNLGLIDTFWAYVIPAAMSVFNVFLMRNYFAAIPDSLQEAAVLDGANYFQILILVTIPLSKAALATIALNDVRGFWNSYMDGILYINNSDLELLQVYLYRMMSSSGATAALAGQGANTYSMETLKMTLISIGMIPVLLLYLFLQKYYVQGMTVGAVKG